MLTTVFYSAFLKVVGVLRAYHRRKNSKRSLKYLERDKTGIDQKMNFGGPQKLLGEYPLDRLRHKPSFLANHIRSVFTDTRKV